MEMKVIGTITRRRSMGRYLAFADIQRCDQNEDDDDDDKSTNGGDIVKVAFRRSSPSWNKDRDDNFPTKTSSLPYGAKVMLDLRLRREPQSGEGTEESLEVHSWAIIDDPWKAAQKIAKVEGQDGISCSDYLKARGDVFLSVNNHPTTDHANATGKRRAEKDATDLQKKSLPSSLSLSDGQYSHGGKKAKNQRNKLFASWLLQKFGADLLRQNGGVLDIAGGKGQLSVELATEGQIPCTIIDPLLRRTKRGQLFLPKDLKRMDKVNGPPPNHIAKPFDGESFLQQNDCESKVKNASCLVGLHPDECTEDILDVALKYGKPVAIVPCCVFPTLFPMRQLCSGRVVRTHEEFLKYLLEKDDRLRIETLLFEGKNQVIYCKSD